MYKEMDRCFTPIHLLIGVRWGGRQVVVNPPVDSASQAGVFSRSQKQPRWS